MTRLGLRDEPVECLIISRNFLRPLNTRALTALIETPSCRAVSGPDNFRSSLNSMATRIPGLNSAIAKDKMRASSRCKYLTSGSRLESPIYVPRQVPSSSFVSWIDTSRTARPLCSNIRDSLMAASGHSRTSLVRTKLITCGNRRQRGTYNENGSDTDKRHAALARVSDFPVFRLMYGCPASVTIRLRSA